MSDGIEINTYYELYCQCKLERDLLKQELQATREQLGKTEKLINEARCIIGDVENKSFLNDEKWKWLEISEKYFQDKQKDEVK